MKKLVPILLTAMGVLLTLTARATPYASCITNSGNTIYFDLNEAGGNVTVTYENGSTNTSFNGVTTGLNLPAGYQNFDLTGHSSYSISVSKTGSGQPSIGTTIARGGPRGLAVNLNTHSKYFGYVYSAIGQAGIVMQNADGSGVLNVNGLNPGGFWGATAYSPNKLSVAADDYVIVGDFSKNSGGVSRIDPTFSTGQLLLAGQGQVGNHGSEESRPILSGTIGVNASLYVVDGSFVDPFNQIFTYNFGTASYNTGDLPWVNQPDLIGTNVNPVDATTGAGLIGYNDSGGFGFYAGLSRASNGYFYCTVQRQNHSNPNLQVYAPDGKTQLWNSFFPKNGTNGDYLLDATPLLSQNTSAPSDACMSPDERYLAMVHIDNHFTILGMTNDLSGGKIPDISTAYTFAGPGTTGNGRGIAWDAAGNLWMSSSGLGSVYQYSLGRSATTITSGDITGTTNFTLIAPTEADIAPSLSTIAQTSGYGGYSNSTTNSITRIGDTSSPLTVNFTVSGTAPASSYTLSVTNSVRFAAGQTSTNVVITAVNDGVPRPITTVVLTMVTNSNPYNVGFQNKATTSIISTATPQLVLTPGAGTMYRVFSNDYTSVTFTRWGDTNTAFTSAAFTYGGTAANGTDFAPINTTVAFAKGDVTKTVRVARPLVNGQPPVDTIPASYTGDKTIAVGVGAGSGYTTFASNGVATVTILDNAYPPTTVLYSNPLTDPNDAANWAIAATCGDITQPLDYNVDFGYDLTANNPNAGNNGLIPLPPSGATTALRITCNKNNGTQAVAVNLYPNVTFSGNYAVRFNMYVVQGQNLATSAEGPLFGINHDGHETNWWYSSGPITAGNTWTADGVWYWLGAWAGGYSSDYMEFTGIANSIPNTGWRRPATLTFASFPNQFKAPQIFTSVNTSTVAVAGLPSNASPFVTNSIGNWADVEIRTSNNVVVLTIDRTQVFSMANTNSLFMSGHPMLGYEVPNAEFAGPDAAVYFSNLRVVNLVASTTATVQITSIQQNGSTATINFTSSNTSDAASAFALQSTSVVNGTFADNGGAVITGSSGSYQATISLSGTTQFYRIRHN